MVDDLQQRLPTDKELDDHYEDRRPGETFLQWEARVNTPLPGEERQSWPLAEFKQTASEEMVRQWEAWLTHP